MKSYNVWPFASGFFRLASSEVHPCCSRCPYLLPFFFFDSVIFYYLPIPHVIYAFVGHWQALGLFPSVRNAVAKNIAERVLVCTPVSYAPGDIDLAGKLTGHTLTLRLTFQGAAVPLSPAAAPLYLPTSSA